MSDIFWTAGFFNERFPAPVSPLGWSVVGPLIDKLALRDPLRWMGYRDADSIPTSRLYHGHPYANVALFQIIYNPFPNFLLPDDAVRYFPNGDTNLRKRAPYPGSLFNPHFLFSLLVHFLRDPLTASPFNFYAWSRFVPRYDRAVGELRAQLERAIDPQEIVTLVNRADDLHSALLRIHRWSLTYADLFFVVLKRQVGIERAEQLVAHTPNKSVQVDNALRELARLLPADQRENAGRLDTLRMEPGAREFIRAFDQFLAKHGHRSFSLDISQPTFAETPDAVFEMVRSLAISSAPPLPLFPSPLLPLLSFARRYVTLREDQRYYWQKALALTRSAFLKLADIFVARAILESREDIFYAQRTELSVFHFGALSQDELRELIATRKNEWGVYWQEFRASATHSYPPFLRGDKPIAFEQNSLQEWRGRGVSAGCGRGPVRIVRHHSELARIRAGDILVAPSTDPAWTLVFARLNGLALERGGVLSHGAVVAREYGLPAVVGLTNITDELREGEMIEVDGNAGIVRRVSSE